MVNVLWSAGAVHLATCQMDYQLSTHTTYNPNTQITDNPTIQPIGITWQNTTGDHIFISVSTSDQWNEMLFSLWHIFNMYYIRKVPANERQWLICSSFFFKSLAPGKFEWNFRHVIFTQILLIGGQGISCENILIWMSLDFTDEQSTLVRVMAWYHRATSHYLSQCWPRSLSPYDVTRPQWVKKTNGLAPETEMGPCHQGGKMSFEPMYLYI